MGLFCREIQVRIIQMKGHGMSNKVLSARLESKLFVNLGHGDSVQVDALLGRGVIVIVPLNKEEKVSSPTLLKDAHERREESLLLICRDFGNAPFAKNKGAFDLTEFKVPRDISVVQNINEFTRGHGKLGDQVNVVVTVTSKLRGRRHSFAKLAVQLQGHSLAQLLGQTKDTQTHLSQIERRALSTVVVIAVHMKDLFALDRQEPRENTFGETRSQDNDIVDFVLYTI